MPVITPSKARNTAAPPVGGAANRALAATLFALAAVLVANTVLGPLVTGAIEYPISRTMLNQLVGLEVISVGLVVPLALIAGVLAMRGHPAAGLLGVGPASYAAYMFVQYVLGPEYVSFTLVAFFHTAVFTLSCVTAVWCWVSGSRQPLPRPTTRMRRLSGTVLLLLASFILTRYLGAFTGSIAGAALPAESADAPTFFWSIFFLDLGVVVPVTTAAAVGLFRGAAVSDAALYAVVTWYALVPPSVAAMSVTMMINDDANASAGQAFFLVVISIVFAALAAWVWRPLLLTRQPRAQRARQG